MVRKGISNAPTTEEPSTTAASGPGKDTETAKCREKLKRKYKEDYIKYGFTVTDKAGDEVPLCFVCSKILSNEAMKPSKLSRHMETNHSYLVGKPIEYFQQMLCDFRGQQTLMTKSAKVSENALKASYALAL